MRDDIEANFALNGQVNVTLDVFPPGAGQIKISTIIPDSLPWTGVYFDGNPVRMTAIPNPGYTFEYWGANAVLAAADTNISIVQNINASTLFQAFFTLTPVSNTVALNYEVQIYPNPFADQLNVYINTEEPAEILVYDISSRKLLQQSFVGLTTLNTGQLASGLYLYEVRTEAGICKQGKIVKR